MKSFFTFLSRNKLYTLIEAIGLVASIAFIILIGNYVWQQYELAYGNPYHNRVYSVGANGHATLSGGDKEELESKLPELENAIRLSNQECVIKIGDEALNIDVLAVDSGFFEIFPEWVITDGDVREFVHNTCLISSELAKKYFNDKNPVGSDVLINSFDGEDINKRFRVIGVFNKPTLSLVKSADIIVLPEDIFSKNYFGFGSIGNFMTLIKVRPGVKSDELLEKVEAIERPHYNENMVSKFKLSSLPELYFSGNQWHLKSGSKEILNLLLSVVLILLITSIINYVNLNLAQSGRRAKEMATRRLHGSSALGIIGRYIGESMLFIFVCGVLGIIVAYLFLPTFRDLLLSISGASDENWMYVSLDITWTMGSVLLYLAFIVLLGLLAGVLPAVLSIKFKPIDIVRGTFRKINRMKFSFIFIIFQNVVSVILISISLVMELQLHHMIRMPLGARTENIYRIASFFNNYEYATPLLNRLSEIPGVKKVGIGSGYPGRITMYTKVSIDDNVALTSGLMIGEKNYFDIMGLEVLAEYEHIGADSEMLFMSESLYNSMETVNDSTLTSYLSKFRINGMTPQSFGGIYGDVPTYGASSKVIDKKTGFFLSSPSNLRYPGSIIIEVDKQTDEMADNILQAYRDFILEKTGTEVEPWAKGYISDLVMKDLEPVRNAIILIELFMILALLISVLGLIAMSTYFSNENTKGIAIRKVLGSFVGKEIRRSIRIYMMMTLVSIGISIPVSVYIAREYLSRFVYRVDNYWWIFVVSGLLSLLVAFLSVIWQTAKAAKTNPVTELKKE